MLVLAADHVVRKPERIPRGLPRRPRRRPPPGRIVTFGIRPTATRRPATATSGRARSSTAARRSRSRPSSRSRTPRRPPRYVAENYLWNSGNFMFRADVMLDEIERFEPAMAEAAQAAVAEHDAAISISCGSPPSRSRRAPKKSIDYAVMERTKLAAVVPADIGLVGRRQAGTRCGTSSTHDAAGNAVDGPGRAASTAATAWCAPRSRCSPPWSGSTTSVVVATGDAVLVAARDKAEDVKALVEQLKAQNRREAVEHRRIYRPWGYYQGVDTGTRYQVKRIVVKPGAQALAAEALPPRRALGRGEGHRRGHGRRGRAHGARERVDLHSDRQRPPARQSRARSRSS